MLKENATLFRFLLRVADGAVAALAFALAFEVRFVSGLFALPPGAPPFRDYLLAAPFVVALALLAYDLFGLYRPRRIELGWAESRDVVLASLTSVIFLLALAELYRGRSYSRLFVATYATILPAAVCLERALARALLRALRRRGWNVRHAIVVGEGPLAASLVERIRANPWTGIELEGALVLEDGARAPGGLTVLGTHRDLERVVRGAPVDQVFLAVPLERSGVLRELKPVLDVLPLDVRLIPDTAGVLPVSPGVAELDGLPVVTLRAGPHDGLHGVVKRAIDIAGALFGLVFLSPLLLLIAVAVRFSSRGPALYRQARVGWGGRPFVMFKFRTMVQDAEHATGPVRTVRDDPRCTRLGALLRRTSLDELPQLVNVLRGEMSLVGPRPERPELLHELEQELPQALLRLTVKAGMTGLAQVRGLRGDTPLRERLEVDLEYVNHWSVWLDVRILAETVVRGFVHPNAI